MRIPRNLIDEINEKTDIVGLVSQYVNLTKRGKNFMGQCPFHDDKSPSFSVSPEKHLAKCMACGEGGTPITFYSKIKNVSFEQAALALAEPLGIKLEVDVSVDKDTPMHALMRETNIFYEYYLHHSESGKQALAYLKKRGLTEADITHFQIGLAPKERDALYQILKSKAFEPDLMVESGVVKQKEDGTFYDLMNYRITFPIHDKLGRIVGFSGRALDNDQVKYLNTPETAIFKKGETLYHLSSGQKDIRMQKNIILHEGFFDVIASYKAGLKQGIATMGTALTRDQVNLISKHVNHVIIAYDGDNAGMQATMKAIPLLEEKKLRIDVVTFPDKLDPDDYLKQKGIEAYRALFSQTQDPFAFGYQFYKLGLDLSNSNDINLFKKRVLLMLKNKDKTLQEIYMKKLADELNVSYDSIFRFKPIEPQFIPKNEPKSTINRDIPLKFIRAERQLLIAMMKDPSVATRIDQALGTQFVADMDLLKLRMVLMLDYYKKYDTFDLPKFKKLLSEDQNQILEMKVIQRLEWSARFTYNEDNITHLLNVMMSITDVKAYQAILKDIQAEKEAYTQTMMVEKQKRIKNKLTKREVTL